MKLIALLTLFWLTGAVLTSSALNKVTNDLSAIARVVNGIALHNELGTNQENVNNFLAELLDFESGDTVGQFLGMNVNARITNERLDTIIEGVKSLANNPVDDSSKIKEAFRSLEAMKGKVTDLENGGRPGSTQVFEDAVKKISYDPPLSDYFKLRVIEDARKKLNRIHSTPATPGTKNIRAFSVAFEELFGSMAGVNVQMIYFKSYDTLDALFEMRGKNDTLKPVIVIADVGKDYQMNMAVFSSMPTTMQTLKTDSDALLPLAQKHANFQLASAELGSIVSELTSISAPRSTPRTLVSGFPNNGKDFDQMFKDFGSDWLKKNIAGGGSVEKLEKALASLKTWIPSLVKLEQTRQRQPMPPNLGDIVKSLSDTFKNISEEGEVLSQTTDLATSISTLSSSISSLQPISGSVNFTEFDIVYTFSCEIEEKVSKLLKIYETINRTADKDFFDTLHAVEDQMSKLDTDGNLTVLQCAKNIKGMKHFQKLVDAMNYISINLTPFANNSFIDFVENPPKLDVLKSVQNSLTGTGLVEALKALKTTTYNSDGIDKMIGFGISARRIQAAQGDITAVKNSIAVIDELKTDVAEVKTAVTSKSSRRRRRDSDAVTIKSLASSMALSSSFGNAVNLLRDMANAHQNRSQLTSAADSGDEVNTLIQSVPSLQQVWTDENRKALKTLVTELENLEKFAAENKDKNLLVMGGVFEKAAEIKGIPLDTGLIKSDLLPVMRNSTSPTVQAALPVFTELANLRLDFARHNSEIKGGMVHLKTIQSFFDDFFGVKRSASGEVMVVENEIRASTKPIIIFVVIVVILAAVVAGAVIIVFLVQRYKKARELQRLAKDPERWNLLAFHHEHVCRQGFNAQIFETIQNGDFVAFKTSIRNGYYVDTRKPNATDANTLLHEAIVKNKYQFAKLLIENGADLTLKNHKYETPMAMAKRLKRKKFVALLQKNEKKTRPKVVPELLTRKMHKVHIESDIRDEQFKKAAFLKKFKDNCSNALIYTHYIVKTDAKNYLQVTENHLEWIFSPTMLMNHLWMAACIKDPDALTDNKEWRVKGFKYQGKTYDTLENIKDTINRRKVPYLFGVWVHFMPTASEVSWLPMQRSLVNLGASGADSKGPAEATEDNAGHSYYRDDIPRQILVYRTPADQAQCQPYLDNTEHFVVFSVEEYIQFVLAFKVNVKKAEQLKVLGGSDGDASSKTRKSKKTNKGKKETKKKGKKKTTEESTMMSGASTTGGSVISS